MAELNIISDEDLKAPLELSQNYGKLADTYDEVIKSATQLLGTIESGVKTTKQQSEVTEELTKNQEKLERTNVKASKSMESVAIATEYADDAMGGAISKAKSLNTQLLKLAVNPVGAVLLAIGAALLAIGTYFRTTNEGANRFEEIMTRLRGVLEFLTSKVADLGRELFIFFSSNSTLANGLIAVFDFLFNRIVGMIETVTNLIKIINILSQYNIKQLLTGDLTAEDVTKLKNAFTDLGKSYAAALFGIGDAADKAKEKTEALIALLEEQRALEDDTNDNILNAARQSLEIEKLRFAAKDKENKTDQERLNALRQSVTLAEQQLKVEVDLATRRERLFTAELAAKRGIVTTEAEANRLLREGITLTQEAALAQKATGEELGERRKLQAEVLNLQRNFFAEQKKNVTAIAALQREIDEAAVKASEEARQQRLNILEREQQASTDIFAKEVEEFKKAKEEKDRLEKNFNQRLLDDRKKRAEQEKEIEKAQTEAYKEELKKREEARQAAELALVLGQELANGFVQQRLANLEIESAALEEQRARELTAAEGDERKKLAINRKFDREQAKIKRQQAQAEKTAALFNIAVNTAVNISRVAPNPVLIALVAAIGAVQAGFVQARPLPKFWKGSDNTPSDFIAGDRGRELVSHKGRSYLANRPTAFLGMPGATVFTNKETEELMRNGLSSAIAAGERPIKTRSPIVVIGQSDENTKWLKAIAKKPTGFITVDDHGFSVGYLNSAEKRRARYKKFFNGIA